MQTQHYAIVDGRMSAACRKTLENYGFFPILLPQNPNYDVPVCAHPDLSLFPYPHGVLALKPAYDSIFEQMFDEEGGEVRHNVMCVGEDFKKVSYPADCRFNFALCGNKLIGNMRVIHPCIAALAEKYGWKKIHVHQGYAKCNICIISENALITEDVGIAAACEKEKIEVLLLQTKGVALNGYDYGFIGGASSSVWESSHGKHIFFCGNFQAHHEAERIIRFCLAHDVRPLSLSDEPLYDYGSVFLR